VYRGPLRILACDSGRPFAEKIVHYLNQFLAKEEKQNNVQITESQEKHFGNTEIKSVINESIRGKDVYIIQDVENSTNNMSVPDNVDALTTMVDAAHRADAGSITVVVPTFPYARQDRAIGREGITAARTAQRIEDNGAKHVVTLDIHNTAIAGFFRIARLENLHASKNILDYIKDHYDMSNVIFSTADVGGIKLVHHYSEIGQTDFTIIHKKRNPITGKIEKMGLLGEVGGLDVIIVDDMIDTGGTIERAVTMLNETKEIKKPKSISVATSLPIFNGKAIQIMENLYRKGYLKSVIGTNAVYHGDDFAKEHEWFKDVDVAKYFARVIYNMNRSLSISALLK
jgi:ribose-phosphate pyrophosphokinase